MTSSGKYITLGISPTINKNTTEYNAEGQWVDSDKITFRDGKPRSQGGYQDVANNRNFVGVSRDIHSWSRLDLTKHYAVGTHEKLEIVQNNTVYDITPIIGSTSSTNILSTVSGTTLVTVSVASHDREVGDFVNLTSVATVSVGGINLQGNEYQVVSVAGPNAYIIDTKTTAGSTVNSGGGLIKIDLPLNSGLQSNGVAYGWGAGTWGTPGAMSGGWGRPRGGNGLAEYLRQWSLDNWGQDLVACPRGGAIYVWDPATSVTSRAVALTGNPPAQNNIILTHPNRFLIAAGTIPEGSSDLDPMYTRWCAQENFNVWDAEPTNLAGGLRLGSGSFIVGAFVTNLDILYITDSAVYAMYPTNDSSVFGLNLVSKDSGGISQHCAVDIDGQVIWMGLRNFFAYNGVINTIDCSVRDFVFSDIDYTQKEKIYCKSNRQFSEIFWFYQSLESTTGEIDKYVKFNYLTGAFDVGTYDRTVWEDAGLYSNPIAVQSTGEAFFHEIGTDANNAPLKSYIESSYFDIEDGTNILLVDQIVPDLILEGLINFTITTQKYPGGPETVKGPYQITPTTQEINFRARGRQAKLRFSTSTKGSSWNLGKPRFRITTDGDR